MKKYILTGLIALGLLSVASFAYADSNYWHINWNDGDDILQTADLYVDGFNHYFVSTNETTRAPEFWKTDTSFIWHEDSNTLSLGNISQDNIDLLVPTLAGKASTSSLNTVETSLNNSLNSLNSNVSSINTKLGNLFNTFSTSTASTSLQRLRVQTDSSGTYTWTFPSAFATGTLPIISVVPEDNTSGVSVDVKITALSNTSVTIQASSLRLVLGILTLNTSPQVYVHLTAIKP